MKGNELLQGEIISREKTIIVFSRTTKPILTFLKQSIRCMKENQVCLNKGPFNYEKGNNDLSFLTIVMF